MDPRTATQALDAALEERFANLRAYPTGMADITSTGDYFRRYIPTYIPIEDSNLVDEISLNPSNTLTTDGISTVSYGDALRGSLWRADTRLLEDITIYPVGASSYTSVPMPDSPQGKSVTLEALNEALSDLREDLGLRMEELDGQVRTLTSEFDDLKDSYYHLQRFVKFGDPIP